MAIAIKPTPVLTGKNAERFLKSVKKEEKNKASLEDIQKAKILYDKIIKKNPHIR